MFNRGTEKSSRQAIETAWSPVRFVFKKSTSLNDALA